jgi:hypothetical protein
MPRTVQQPGTLMTETLRELRSRRASLIDIHRRTGLPFYWLRHFASEEIKDPSVNRVQALYEHLTGRKLIADE